MKRYILDKADREAHVIIERARKSIKQDSKHAHGYTNEQFHAIGLLLHAGDCLRLGEPISDKGAHSKYFFERR